MGTERSDEAAVSRPQLGVQVLGTGQVDRVAHLTLVKAQGDFERVVESEGVEGVAERQHVEILEVLAQPRFLK